MPMRRPARIQFFNNYFIPTHQTSILSCCIFLVCIYCLLISLFSTGTRNNIINPTIIINNEIIEPSNTINPNNLPIRKIPPNNNLITFYATAKQLDVPQLTSIRSWLNIGADVIMFIDDLNTLDVELTNSLKSFLTTNTDGEDTTNQLLRLRFLSTPEPRSQAGSPRLDIVMAAGEQLARTEWVCLINADIVVPHNFGQLPSYFVNEDVMVIGSRHDCRFNPDLKVLPPSVVSFEDLERYSMAPCWPHGVGGKDYYLYKKHFFQRHGIEILPFWIGKFVWDHWLVNVTSNFAVDATPTIIIGHMSHNHYWTENLITEQDRKRKQLIKQEIEYNARITNCGSIPIPHCLRLQSVYDVKWQLCPHGVLRPINGSAHKAMYNRAVSEYRLQRVNARRMYQNLSLTGSSPNYWGEQLKLGIWPGMHGC
jgi:hypothetical protein